MLGNSAVYLFLLSPVASKILMLKDLLIIYFDGDLVGYGYG